MVYIRLLNYDNKVTYSDQEGVFAFSGLAAGTYHIRFSSFGFKNTTDTIVLKEDENIQLEVRLEEETPELPAVVITARRELSQTTINSIDFRLRPHTTTQDLLRLVPGLFIAQHAGGGKAEQIFLRGFDVDHGTDVAVSVDGMPVNMASHAHGQGYADLHFVIPETVGNMTFSKGPYDAKTGDFNTAGAVRFQTKNTLPANMIKYEAGRFGTQRGVAMVSLIPRRDTALHQKHSAYLASEYFYSQGYFKQPQDFHRLNVFGKYHGQLSPNSYLTGSLSTFHSRWNASGQIPQRAVDSGLISWFGAIDPTEGGATGRSNANALLTTYLPRTGVIRNQVYFTDYLFSLYSNFTFYKNDSTRGDQIYQHEHRKLFGYNASCTKDLHVGTYTLSVSAGGGFRSDRIGNIGLAHTVKRQFLNDIKKGDISENNVSAYAEATLLLSEKMTINGGVRYDFFTFRYKNLHDDDALAVTHQGILSPKLNVYYKIAQDVQLYASGGYGFHSNDARVAVYRTDTTSLPRARSADFGTNFKLGKRLFVNAALWYMTLQTEYVYSGDDGMIGPSGRTRRAGVDISARFQLLAWLFADTDLNLACPRYVDLPRGKNYVPLAPSVTSTGGISIHGLKGFSGSVRYRLLGKRPATEDNSVTASGYFLLDAVVNYQRKHYQLTFSAENLLNRKWREAQFGTESKLKDEQEAVTEIHFTPGTPFFLKAGIACFF